MSRKERVARAIDLVVNIEAGLLVAYQLLIVWYSLLGVSEHFAIFFGAVFSMAILMHISETLRNETERSRISLAVKLGLLAFALVAGVFSALYIQANTLRLESEVGLLNPVDMAVGLSALAALCIAGYYVWGKVLVGFVILAVGYFMWGYVLPGFWGHQEYGLGWVLSYTTMHPVFGTYWLIPLTTDVIFYVLLISSVLARTGTVDALLEMGKAVGQRITGGAAYPALIGSATVGTMVGQAVANVIITGRVTIPTMIRQGVPPPMAAAVESSASAGALIMPPIMGLGAFVMAFFLNMPYIQVALAATIPAILYYAGVGLGIYFHARVSGMPRGKERVDWHLVARCFPTFVVGIGILATLLLSFYTAKLAGFWALLGTIAAALLIQGKYRPKVREIFLGLLDGAKTCAVLGLLLAVIGPVSQTAMTTGFGVNLANMLIISPVGQILFIALPLVMLCTLFTGLAIIEAAAYIIMALALAPYLIEIGFDRVASHMYIYYFSVFATLMPPIAITAQAASRIAEADFWEVCGRALKLAFVALAVPFVFVLNPVLLEFPKISLAMLIAFVETLAGLTMLAAAFWGWLVNPLKVHERIVLAVSGVLLLAAAALNRVDLAVAGLALAGLMWTWERFKRRREAGAEATAAARELEQEN